LALLVPEESEPWAILAGSKAPLIILLHAKNGDRLIDESLSLTPLSGQATKQAWDRFEVEASSAGEASFPVHAGGASFAAKATVVRSIDDTTPINPLSIMDPPSHVALGGDQILCFIARSAGKATAAATWTH